MSQPVPPELAAALAKVTERFTTANNQHEMNARMYAASQAELNAAERELRELGRACTLWRTAGLATTTASAESLASEIAKLIRGANPSAPVAAPTNGAPVQLHAEAQGAAGGDPKVLAGMRWMAEHPGQPLPPEFTNGG